MADGVGRTIGTASQRDVRAEGFQVEGKTGAQQRVVDLLSQLKQQGMSSAHPHPNDVGRSRFGESAASFQLEKKRFHMNPLESGRAACLGVDRLRPQIAQGEMKPFRGDRLRLGDAHPQLA